MISLLPIALSIMISGEPREAAISGLSLPAIVPQADLIVLADVKEAGPGESRTAAFPELDYSGFPKPLSTIEARTETVRAYTIEPVTVYSRRDSTNALPPTLPVVAISPPEGGIHSWGNARFMPRVRPEAGRRYFMILRAMADGVTYYLPTHAWCCRPADDAAQRLGPQPDVFLNPDKWDWMKPDERGLQMTMILRDPVVTSNGVTTLEFVAALRNTSEETRWMLFHVGLKPLELKVFDADDKPVTGEIDLYAGIEQADPRSVVPFELHPHQIVYVSSGGPTLTWSTAPISLKPGAYKVETRYIVPDMEGLPADIWRGVLYSGPESFTVAPPP